MPFSRGGKRNLRQAQSTSHPGGHFPPLDGGNLPKGRASLSIPVPLLHRREQPVCRSAIRRLWRRGASRTSPPTNFYPSTVGDGFPVPRTTDGRPYRLVPRLLQLRRGRCPHRPKSGGSKPPPYDLYPTSVQHRRGGCPHPPASLSLRERWHGVAVTERASKSRKSYYALSVSLSADSSRSPRSGPPFVCFADIFPRLTGEICPKGEPNPAPTHPIPLRNKIYGCTFKNNMLY